MKDTVNSKRARTIYGAFSSRSRPQRPHLGLLELTLIWVSSSFSVTFVQGLGGHRSGDYTHKGDSQIENNRAKV